MSETLVAVLTPPGQSALATIGLRGPRAWEVLRELFRPRGQALPTEPETGRFWLGTVGAELADEAILAVRSTGLELHAHGGRAVTQYLLELFQARGLRLSDWDEYLADEVASTLARTMTVRTASIVLTRGLADVATLPLTRRARVVIAGAPNVGKSSLINALAGYQRSVVSPTPGTTRDVTTTATAIDGWPVELIDTAGLRATGEELESAGIDQAREVIAQADVCLWLVDASQEPVWPDQDIKTIHLVVNKCDLQPGWDLSRAGDAPRISATTDEGIPALLDRLSQWLVPCPPDAAVAVSR